MKRYVTYKETGAVSATVTLLQPAIALADGPVPVPGIAVDGIVALAATLGVGTGSADQRHRRRDSCCRLSQPDGQYHGWSVPRQGSGNGSGSDRRHRVIDRPSPPLRRRRLRWPVRVSARSGAAAGATRTPSRSLSKKSALTPPSTLLNPATALADSPVPALAITVTAVARPPPWRRHLFRGSA